MIKAYLWVPFILGLLAVIVLSVIPAKAFPDLGLPEILGHTVAYAVLALAGGFACRSMRSFLMLTAALVLLGAGLEFAQALLPTRDASGSELMANFVGIALGVIAVNLVNVHITKCWRGTYTRL
jgi:VanZ family protein